MKATLLYILAIATFSNIVMAQTNTVTNGNFENWTPVVFENPMNYENSSNNEIFRDGSNHTFNCIKTEDAQNGNFAVRLTTNPNGEVGYFTPSKMCGEDPTTWVGGIPYDQAPTGISGFYKSNINPGDKAFILVSFSLNGTSIGFYTFDFTTTQTDYTPFSFTFVPALSQVPDNVVFGAASSDAFNEISTTGNMLQLDNVMFTGVTAQPELFNGDFEEWKLYNNNNPNDWILSTISIDNSTVKSTDAFEGNYAVELTTSMELDNDDCSTFFAIPSELSTGYWDRDCNCKMGGNPYNLQTDSFTFRYKYAPSGNDKANVWLQFKKNGVEIGNIGRDLEASPDYQYVILPFFLPEAPDTVIITFSSTLWENQAASYAGSKLTLDAVQFLSETLNVSENQLNQANTFYVFNNTLYFKNTQNIDEIKSVEVFNLLGQKVFKTSKIEKEIQFNSLQKGMYILKVESSNNNYSTLKFIIK